MERSIVANAGARLKSVVIKRSLSDEERVIRQAENAALAARARAKKTPAQLALEEKKRAEWYAKYPLQQRAKTGGATQADFAAAGEGFEGEDNSDWFYGFIFFVFIAFILSPGVLLTIPPGRGGIFMSRNTSIIAAIVHALLLGVIISTI